MTEIQVLLSAINTNDRILFWLAIININDRILFCLRIIIIDDGNLIVLSSDNYQWTEYYLNYG